MFLDNFDVKIGGEPAMADSSEKKQLPRCRHDGEFFFVMLALCWRQKSFATF